MKISPVAIKSFITGMMGAFDLSGQIFRQQRNEMLEEIKIRAAKLEAMRKEIDAKSTRHLSIEESIALDWQNVGNDLRKAMSIHRPYGK